MSIKYGRGKGNLSFLVWWQTLDGRLQIDYFDSYSDAKDKVEWLKVIGRDPQMWRKVTT